MDVAATVGEGEGLHVPIHAHALALGRVRVLGLVLDRRLGPRGIVGGAILTSLRGMADTVGGAEVDLGPVEEAEEEAGVVDIGKLRGLVLHLAGVVGSHAGGRRAMNAGDTEGAERGHPRTLYVPVGHGRDLTLALVHALHVLGRGPAPCLTPLTRGTAGVGAGVVRVLDLRVVEGGATAKTISETAAAGRGRRGISCIFQLTRFIHLFAGYVHRGLSPCQLFLFILYRLDKMNSLQMTLLMHR